MSQLTNQIGGPSPFKPIPSFLAYAIERQTRTDPRTAWAPKPAVLSVKTEAA